MVGETHTNTARTCKLNIAALPIVDLNRGPSCCEGAAQIFAGEIIQHFLKKSHFQNAALELMQTATVIHCACILLQWMSYREPVTIITATLSHRQIRFRYIPNNNHLRWHGFQAKNFPREPPTSTPSNDPLPSSQHQKTFQISLTKRHRRGRRQSGGAVLLSSPSATPDCAGAKAFLFFD